MTRSDRFTNTLADAGRYDQTFFAPGREVTRYDVSSTDAAMMAQERRDDAAQAERDAKARARGEYVPTAAMSIAADCCVMALGQRGLFNLDADPIREGVVNIRPTDRGKPAPAPDEIIAAMAVCYPDAEVTFAGGVVWAKIVPFETAGV
jgi:hypothetical protein